MKEEFLEKQLHRYKGAMFGLAVGDALDAPVEFFQRDVQWIRYQYT